MICAFAYAANAAPPAVTFIQAGQRAGTKLVDINYTLALDPGQKAFVELWFSPDNGLTYPVRCMAVTGDADANVTAGSKTAVWNAENDWDHQFTNNGRIRVIATYGDQSSGFAGSGSSGGGGSGSGYGNLNAVPWSPYFAQASSMGGGPPAWQNKAVPITDPGPDGIPGNGDDGMTMNLAQEITGSTLSKIHADPTEVTNAQWNEVASWGRANDYTNLQDAPANDDNPRANVTFWDALRWCNARSEKEGLTPAYYMEANEGVHDINQNGSFETGEYFDLDGNGQYSPGLATVFRTGANIPNYGKSVTVGSHPNEYWAVMSPIKKDANGYRLPTFHSGVFPKLATGGNHQKKWPWGDDNPPGVGGTAYADFAQHVRATAPPASSFSSPSPATSRQANGYGLKDMLGNVAEWAEDGSEMDDGFGNMTFDVPVYGGSYLGIPAGAGDPNLWEALSSSPGSTTSPAIGLRCVRYEP